MSDLTHFDERGNARMVDVGAKDITERVATAKASVIMKPATLKLIRDKKASKGDVLTVAQLAGIMAAKKTPDLIGVNNRNLKTLNVDLAVTEQLAPMVPKDRVLVAESGLGSPADLARMAKVGASAFLIGESFMRKPDVEAAVREILAKAA